MNQTVDRPISSMKHGRRCKFWAPGVPVTKGSTRSFVSKSTRRIVTVPQLPKLKSWEATVHWAAYAEWEGPPLQSPVIMQCRFVFVRPPSHFTARGALTKSAPFAPRHDLDKLTRAVWDGLTGIVFDDDNRVVKDANEKEYGERAGVEVTVIELVTQPMLVGAAGDQ